jgi:GDPmannose 4,6-dehydratase
MKAIILGAGGQDGHFLCKHLLKQGHEVLCFSHRSGSNYPALDVGDFEKVENIVREIKPDYVYHLAAKSSTRHEFILQNQRSIVSGTLAILEAVDKFSRNTKVFLASSGLIFRNEQRPIAAEDELQISSAYSVARIEALQIARYYRSRGIKVYVGHLFNHESPLRPSGAVVRSLVKDVVDISVGKTETFTIGNPEVVKEWMWAGDAVAAIQIFIRQDDIFEICLADGEGISVRRYAELCCEKVGISYQSHHVTSSGYQTEYSMLVGNSETIRGLGWSPKVNIESLVARMVESEILSRNDKNNV